MRRTHAALAAALLLGLLGYTLEREALLSEPASYEETVSCALDAEPEPKAEAEPEVEAEAQPEPEPEAQPELEPEAEAEAEAELDPALATMLLVADNTVVLSTQAAPEWGKGRFYEPPGRSTYRVAKRAAPEQLPAELAAWRDRSVDVYDAEGRVCSARLGALHVVSQYDGYGLVGLLGKGWDGDAVYECFGEVYAPAPVRFWRRPLWNAGPHWLVAELETESDCTGALWARDAALPAPSVLRRFEGPHPAAEARLAAFERSEELARMRSKYRQWYADRNEAEQRLEATWEQQVENAPAKVSWWTDGDAVRMLELDFGYDYEICGGGWGYDARITMLERVEGDERIDTKLWANVVAIFDADGDGRWEYLYSNDAWRPGWSLSVVSESHQVLRELSVGADFAYVC